MGLRYGAHMSGDLHMTFDGPPLHSMQVLLTTAGSGTHTIPSGYTTGIFETWGATGASGGGDPAGSTQGGGAASGSYCRSSFAVAAAGGETVDYVVGLGPGGASSISSGTFSLTTMSAPGGGNGGTATISAGGAGGVPGAIGTGGTAANVAGNAGDSGQGPATPSATGAGGTGVTGLYASGPTAPSGHFLNTGGVAKAGQISFTYLP